MENYHVIFSHVNQCIKYLYFNIHQQLLIFLMNDYTQEFGDDDE